MPIAFGVTGTVATGTSTLTVTIPAGAAVNSTMVMSIMSTTATAVSSAATATGWTQRDVAANTAHTPSPTLTVLWRRCQAGDAGSTVAITFASAPSTCIGVISTYIGVDPVPFEASSGTTSSGSSSTHQAGPITTTNSLDWIVASYGDRSASTWTPPATYTERSDTATGSQSSMETTDSAATVASGSISPTATGSNSTNTAVMWVGALKPAATSASAGAVAATAVANTPVAGVKTFSGQATSPAEVTGIPKAGAGGKAGSVSGTAAVYTPYVKIPSYAAVTAVANTPLVGRRVNAGAVAATSVCNAPKSKITVKAVVTTSPVAVGNAVERSHVGTPEVPPGGPVAVTSAAFGIKTRISVTIDSAIKVVVQVPPIIPIPALDRTRIVAQRQLNHIVVPNELRILIVRFEAGDAPQRPSLERDPTFSFGPFSAVASRVVTANRPKVAVRVNAPMVVVHADRFSI